MPHVHVNGVDLYYEVHGEGAPILGIHGTPSSALLWVDAAKELASLGRCIVYDRRGFSRSSRPDPFETLDLSEHVEDAAGLLVALSATPAIVVGRSTGGLVALALAHRFRRVVRAFVLLEPAVFTADPDASRWAAQLRARVLQAAADPSAAAEVVLREALGDSTWEALPHGVHKMFANESPAVLAEMRGRGLDISGDPFRLTDDQLASIDLPTLLVSSRDSPSVLRRVNHRLAAALPRAEEALVAGGHFIDPAHPVVLDFVDRFLRSSSQGSGE